MTSSDWRSGHPGPPNGLRPAPTRSSPVPTQSGAEGVDRTGSPPGGGEHRVAHDGQG